MSSGNLSRMKTYEFWFTSLDTASLTGVKDYCHESIPAGGPNLPQLNCGSASTHPSDEPAEVAISHRHTMVTMPV
ncbi:hypothetical protein AK812_SmicGene13739 [Symbiodinium microadriaticum]|uniref:Uncharacterized protein n=1 Tax=Symbiodinium microadriaticum TaxID=2951 RepID=A0A1Q9E7C2_SYMMI|nr:hypothetical protein AK812_SmicGene13739 [Symbiodinium microadriaticum]